MKDSTPAQTAERREKFKVAQAARFANVRARASGASTPSATVAKTPGTAPPARHTTTGTPTPPPAVPASRKAFGIFEIKSKPKPMTANKTSAGIPGDPPGRKLFNLIPMKVPGK
jgi:hypothetical protein